MPPLRAARRLISSWQARCERGQSQHVRSGSRTVDSQVNRRRVFAVTASLAALLVSGAVCSSAQAPLQVSLEQRFGRAKFRSCELNVQVVDRIGRSTLRCVWNISPPTEFTSARALTSHETRQLMELTGDDKTWSGSSSGKDLRSVDGITETVTIRHGAKTTVLTASGNPSFDTGVRRQLLDLLHLITEDLQRTAIRRRRPRRCAS